MRRLLLALSLLLVGVSTSFAQISGGASAPGISQQIESGAYATATTTNPCATVSDIDIQAWCNSVAFANTNATELSILNTMATCIKSPLGITAFSEKFDRFWVPGFLANSAAAPVDLVARASFTLVNAPTFTGQKGYTGNGSSNYINSGWAFNTGVNWTQNSAAWFIYVQTMETRTAAAYVQFGSFGTGHSSTLFGKSTGTTQVAWSVNDASNTSTTSTVAPLAGRWSGERTAAGAEQLYFSGAQVATGTNASGARDSLSATILGGNNAGSPAFFTQSTVAAWYFSASLGSTNLALVDACIHAAGQATNIANFP